MELGGARTRSVPIVGLLLCLAFALALVAADPVAAGGPIGSRCTYSDGVVRVEMYRNNAHGTLGRDASGVIYYYDHNSTREPCGAATVFSTERIVVEDTLKGAFTAFFLDISEGQFASNGDEIPIRIDLGPSGYDGFILYGGGEEDFWTFGRNRANLQRDQAAEIVFVNLPETASAWSAGGRDRVCATGGRGTGRASLVPWGIDSGARGDTLCGGGEEDLLVGADGNDVLRGRGAFDVLHGGAGRDLMFGNAQGDSLEGDEGADRLRGGSGEDRLNGGPGFDDCAGGAPEFQRNCET